MSKFNMPPYPMPYSIDMDCHPPGGSRPEHCPPGQEVELSCGRGSGVALPLYTSGAPVPDGSSLSSLVAGTVTLDTNGMVKPAVKIDFAAIINFLAEISYENFYISILFKLSKVCEGDKVPLGTWTYQKAVNAMYRSSGAEDSATAAPVNGEYQIDFRESFGFNWCECQECPACCTYLVEVAAFQTYSIQSASITNVSISAMAVG